LFTLSICLDLNKTLHQTRWAMAFNFVFRKNNKKLASSQKNILSCNS
jgi:hypothetical protein